MRPVHTSSVEMTVDNPLKPYRPYLAMLFLFGLILAGTIWVLRRPDPPPMIVLTATPRPTATLALILVDVRGAVAEPGVYSLPVGSRVQDALKSAGGTLPDAETREFNLARKLNDGEQIYVRTSAEATSAPLVTPGKSDRSLPAVKTPTGPININTATVEELDALPGIGPAIGQRIVDYRTQNGPFQKIEDIKQVRGIGDAIFEQIKDLITVQ